MEWQLQHFGAPLVAVPSVEAAPGPGQVRLRMRASSLNYRDLLMIRGHYDPRVPRPLVPCSDGVGVVEAVGHGVSIAVGTRLLPIFAAGWIDGPPLASHGLTTRGGPLPGTLSSSMCVSVEATLPVPDFLTDAEAACLPCAGVTAWHALTACGIRSGSTLLTLGTGGVSIFALQLAKALGARVAITSSSDEKLERARALGADLTLNYRTDPSWGKTVAAWHPVDGVIEVGGVGTLGQSLRAVKVGGTVALIGVLAGASGEVPLVRALMSSLRIQGIFVGSRAHLEQLLELAVRHQVRPVVDRVFHFSEVPRAFEHLESGQHFGKVVIEHGG